MHLYLVRHAQAQERLPHLPDERRALTRKGGERFARAVEGLRRLGIEFDRIDHSPLLRAVETAELLATLLDGETRVDAALARPPDEALLAGLSGEHVALVGHEPYLSDLALWLVLGWRVYEQADRAAPFEIDKGGVVVLAGEPRPGAMVLQAHLPPRVLDEL